MNSLPQLSILKGPTRPLVPKPINKIFEQIANGSAKNKLALIFEDNDELRQYSYDEVEKLANQMARQIVDTIKNNNTKPNLDGDYLIAINMHPSDHLVIALLAIWKAGAAYLPLDHEFPGQRIEHILLEAKPALIIYDDEESPYYLNIPRIFYQNLHKASKSQPDNSLQESECIYHAQEELAKVLYTSGSTGTPKGVRLPHRTILNRLQWQFKAFPYSNTEQVCVFKTALTFLDSASEIWGPLISGLTLLIVQKNVTKDPEKLIGLLDKYKVERLVLVPSLLRSMLMFLNLEKSNQFLQHLKLWVCSGETLTVSLAEEFFKTFGENNDYRLCNFYGSTEVMADVTFHICSNKEQLKNQNTIPIGLPVDNTIIYLLDQELRPVKSGQMGELFVAGFSVASGYVNGRDKDKFLDNHLAIDPNFTKLYRTGDFAKIEKGVIVYEGRTDSQVKIRGHRVDLSEIEKAIASIAGIEKSVVLCYKPGEINQALIAFVTVDNLINESQIEGILKTKLNSYMLPQVILLETIPHMVNGKVDRRRLLKSYENANKNGDDCYEVEIDYSKVPEGKMVAAKVLFETVASVLNRTARSSISVEANFYEIGGNSLNSIYTITKLAEHGYKISINDFLFAIDLGEVLERMTSNTAITVTPPIFTAELLRDEHKLIVLKMIAKNFCQKVDVEHRILQDLPEADYVELIDVLWPPLLEKNLSFVTKTRSDKIIGVSLCFDARDEPDVKITSELTVMFEFLESIEGPIRDTQLPPGKGKVLHSFMMGTHSSLTPKENVAVMKFMEDEVLRLAKEREFAGIFATNTSPLTQQLGVYVYKYQTILNYQVNQYVASDGSKPFRLVSDDQKALVQWKPIC